MKKIFKNPYVHSIIAEIYIIAIVLLGHLFARPNTPDKFYDPVIALSLFVFSAAVMGYLFLGEPLQLYLNGEKKQAVTYFFKTLVGFAVIALVAIVFLRFL